VGTVVPVAEEEPDPRPWVVVDRAMAWAEGVLYAVVGIVLVASTAVALGAISYDLVTHIDEGALDAVATALDGLLLVFILVELLGAVRTTVSERQLLAEPFLIVGMIASIKAIVVTSLETRELHGEAFEDAILEIGVLGAVVVLLAVAGFLVRRKEREPREPDG
jgi:uncharacterized membrane protein (DUF373 family)